MTAPRMVRVADAIVYQMTRDDGEIEELSAEEFEALALAYRGELADDNDC